MELPLDKRVTGRASGNSSRRWYECRSGFDLWEGEQILDSADAFNAVICGVVQKFLIVCRGQLYRLRQHSPYQWPAFFFLDVWLALRMINDRPSMRNSRSKTNATVRPISWWDEKKGKGFKTDPSSISALCLLGANSWISFSRPQMKACRGNSQR